MEVSTLIKKHLKDIFENIWQFEISTEDIDLGFSKDKRFGDYTTNVCLRVSKDLQQSPQEIAKEVVYRLLDLEIFMEIGSKEIEVFKSIEVEDPGFINFKLSENLLLVELEEKEYGTQEPFKNDKNSVYRTQNVLFEYTDPNPFKVFHIGHLMSNAIGEYLSRSYQFLGAEIKRVNYQGDVGLHVAKAIWGVIQKLGQEKITLDDLSKESLDKEVRFLGDSYVLGANAYKNNDESREEIEKINVHVFIAAQERLVEEEDWKPIVDYKKLLSFYENDFDDSFIKKVKQIYVKGRKWSLEEFENIYDILGTKFSKYYFESLTGEYGTEIVRSNIGDVFEKDQGAIIFRGEDYGLHNRVFINSLGLPTYEAKDLGLAILKNEDFKYDSSYIITGNEISEYFKVVIKALSKIKEDLAEKTTHIGHGMLLGSDGKQMSSRTGKVLGGVELLEEVKDAILVRMEESGSDLDDLEKEDIAKKLALGAVKYSILKQRFGKDIIFDKESIISITGATGPYLQYTHARSNSILTKVGNWDFDLDLILYDIENGNFKLEKLEKEVIRHLHKFDNVVLDSIDKLSSSIICDYLMELAQLYNTLYNDLPIISADTEASRDLRLKITEQVRDHLKVGLWLLGIEAPEKV